MVGSPPGISPGKTSVLDEASPDGVVCWVGIIIDDHLKARISIDGKVSEIHEVSLYELLAALDEAARFVSANGIR